MDVHSALRRSGGAAKTNRLRELGVTRSHLEKAIREGSIIRVRKGWFALATISPIERRALIDHGFLTCASAARVKGLPSKEIGHYHLRSNRPVENQRSGRRRKKFTSVGALVSTIDMIEDYLHCQPAEWSLALVDCAERSKLVSENEWRELSTRLPQHLSDIVQRRSAIPESPLESVVRYRLTDARIPFEMQFPIGNYRVDFLIGHAVVLETHGAEFHATKTGWERDRERTLWLKGQGYEVIEMTYAQLGDWATVRTLISTLRRRQLRR